MKRGLVIVVLGLLAWLGARTFLRVRHDVGRYDVGQSANKSAIQDELSLWSMRTDAPFVHGFKSSAEAFAALVKADQRQATPQRSWWMTQGPLGPLQVWNPWDLYSSRNDSPKAMAYVAEHLTLNDDVVFYRYNQGLDPKGPPDLIVLYGRIPSRWMFDDDKRDSIGRTVLTVGMTWEFLPEDQFEVRQKRTLDYLKEGEVFIEVDSAESGARRLVEDTRYCYRSLPEWRRADSADPGTFLIRFRAGRAACDLMFRSTSDLVDKAEQGLATIEPKTLRGFPRRLARHDRLRATLTDVSRFATRKK